jgi:hypothetical protein
MKLGNNVFSHETFAKTDLLTHGDDLLLNQIRIKATGLKFR